MKKIVLIVVSVCCCVVAGFAAVDVSPVSALSGGAGYGDGGVCVQSPGAQAGADVYAGSFVPYPVPGNPVVVPDSLDVIYVAHVGRHGSRYMSSDKYTARVLQFLNGRSGLTSVGVRVKRLCEAVDSVTGWRWGALDALGCEQQAGIGNRFAVRYSDLLDDNGCVKAESSYVPRCVMSMDEMTHGVVWQRHDVELYMGSGKRYSALLRPFDTNTAYKAYRESGVAERVYEGFCDTVEPAMTVLRLYDAGASLVRSLCDECIKEGVSPDGASLERAVASKLASVWPQRWVEQCGVTKEECLKVATALYKVVGGVESLPRGGACLPPGVQSGWQCYFTSQEFYRLWECENLNHYLNYSASVLSRAPERMAAPLLESLTDALESASKEGYSGPAATLMFGHAETLMPLYSLLDLPGCRYLTDDWGSVAEHWMDWDIVPMAANLQLVLCRSKADSGLYLLIYRDERQVGQPEPWAQALPKLRALLQCDE